jgi:hypothetical protein
VFSESSATIAAALTSGAELLNPSARKQGARPAVSPVDAAYVAAQERLLREMAARLKDEPFVGYYYGKDEPSIHVPEGPPGSWGAYGKELAKDVREDYGFERFEAPLPNEPGFAEDPDRAFRWIAFNRWASDRFILTRGQLRTALRRADPHARYSPANYWFMSGLPPLDYSRLAACSDLVECDPYASSAERRRGRGVFNHGFGAKFLADLTGKPVRIVAQAFDYNGYDISPENLREWVSQALRCGASAITYYDMDSPRWTHPDRWKMMLHLSRTITRMHRVSLPDQPDTAVLYALHTHMSHGYTTRGDELYSAHALLGELAGSWFKFVSDVQLERGEASLEAYKVVYLPLAKYVTPGSADKIEDFVRNGGVLVCGDPEAFSFDLIGHDAGFFRERLLGITTRPRKTRTPETLILASTTWGLPAASKLPVLAATPDDAEAAGTESPGPNQLEITLTDPQGSILARFADGTPAMVSRPFGKGRAITFAANPFAPAVAVDSTLWPELFKGLQQSLGCKVDLPIWRFLIPPPPVDSKPGAPAQALVK